MIEFNVKLTNLVSEFDISKEYVFSKTRYIEFHKLDLQQHNARYESDKWLDVIDGLYVNPITKGNAVIKYLNQNGQYEKLLILPQECCEVETMQFKMKGE